MPADHTPADIDPQSDFRLPLPKRADLDEAGQRIFDRVHDPKGGTIAGLKGPAGIQLYSPQLAELARPVNNYLRHEAGLGERVRELAILATAREFDSQFEWAAHEPEALSAGIAPAIIDTVRHRTSTAGLAEADAIIIELARAVFGAKKVTSEIYARAIAAFGPRSLVNLVSLMGNYAATAALLATFDMQLRPGQKPLLPPLGVGAAR
jgi:4-carboxymuconolactone decarboxylase